MNKKLLVVLVIVVIGVASIFLLSNQKKETPSSSITTSQNPSPTNTSSIDLGAGGSSYLDETGIYSFLYPNDYVLDTQDPKHIRIYKRGETQRPQSEMSDGALMVFETIDLSGLSLEKWVDKHIKESTADGTSEIVEAKKSITQNSYPGFKYSLRGLGIAQYLVLQKNPSSNNAVVITYSVSDPEQKGYQKDVNAVLASLQLLK